MLVLTPDHADPGIESVFVDANSNEELAQDPMGTPSNAIFKVVVVKRFHAGCGVSKVKLRKFSLTLCLARTEEVRKQLIQSTGKRRDNCCTFCPRAFAVLSYVVLLMMARKKAM